MNSLSIELTNGVLTAIIDGTVVANPPALSIANDILALALTFTNSSADVTATELLNGWSSAGIRLKAASGYDVSASSYKSSSGRVMALLKIDAEMQRALLDSLADGSTLAPATLSIEYWNANSVKRSFSIPCSVNTQSALGAVQTLTGAQQAQERANIVAAQPLVLVASQLGPVGSTLSNGTDLNRSYRLLHTFQKYTTGIRLRYGNYQVSGTNVESGPGNAITVTAAFEYGGISYPVTWAGASSIVIANGGVAPLSDPIPVDIPAGATAYSRSCPTVTSGQKWAQTGTMRASTDSYTINSDVTQATGAMASTSDTGACYSPIEIVGYTYGTSISVLGVGDSIMRGTNDTTGRAGFFAKAMGDSFAWLNTGVGGTSLASWATSGNVRQRLQSWGLTGNVVIELGTNDLAAANLSAMKTNLIAIATAHAARGVSVYACTVIPYTTSSDSWVTAGNQTVTANEAIRVAYNTWLRSLPAPLSGIFDLAAAIEANASNVITLNGGRWYVNGGVAPTADGIHPTTAVHAVMAAAINTTVFK